MAKEEVKGNKKKGENYIPAKPAETLELNK